MLKFPVSDIGSLDANGCYTQVYYCRCQLGAHQSTESSVGYFVSCKCTHFSMVVC